MKWFKHDSDAHRDAKLKKLLIKYGLQGYGLYFYCLELIVNDIDDENLTFELEYDSELIAHDLNLSHELIQEMMAYMVKLDLFEMNSGVITCLKIARRLDKSMTSNPAIRKLIDEVRTSHDSIMIQSDKPMQDKNRLDKKRLIPKDFKLTDSLIEYAKKKDITDLTYLENFTEEFINSCNQHAYKYADFDSAWKTWLRKRIEKDNTPINDKESKAI